MAIKKATAVADLMAEPKLEASTVASPAEVKVESPSGAVTTVPAGLLPVLIESGYTELK